MDWSNVSRVEETPEHLYVVLGTLQGVIIPKRGQDAGTLEAVRAIPRACGRREAGRVRAGAMTPFR